MSSRTLSFEEKHGVEIKTLGKGTHGRVYLTSKNKVIKVSTTLDSLPTRHTIFEIAAMT